MKLESKSDLELNEEIFNRGILKRVGWFTTIGTGISFMLEAAIYVKKDGIASEPMFGLGLLIASGVAASKNLWIKNKVIIERKNQGLQPQNLAN